MRPRGDQEIVVRSRSVDAREMIQMDHASGARLLRTISRQQAAVDVDGGFFRPMPIS